jgi:hypothetical protein
MSAVKGARADEAGRKKYLDATLAVDPGIPTPCPTMATSGTPRACG